MKRLLATLLCALLLALPALAEPETGTSGMLMWLEPEGEAGWTLTLPSGWFEGEVDEASAAEGIFAVAASENGALRLKASYETREEASTAEALQAELAETNPSAYVITIGESNYVQYEDAESAALALLIPGAAGVVRLQFFPVLDESAALTADAIFQSILPMEEAGV